MRRKRRLTAIIVALCLIGTIAGVATGIADNARGQSGTSGSAKNLKVIFVGLAAPSDTFFGIIARGAGQAGKDLGIKVQWIYPDHFTVAEYNNRIEEALAARPDGIVIIGIDPASAARYAAQARKKGIVVGYNPAPPIGKQPLRIKNDPFIGRVGSDEYASGQAAGRRFWDAGAKGAVCSISHVGDQTQVDRCKGMTDFLKSKGVKTSLLTVPNEPGGAGELITNFLRAHKDVNAVANHGQPGHGGMRLAKENLHRKDLLLGGWDIDPQTLKAIENGTELFTIDQEPFWRGYIPVLEIVHYIRYGLVQANYFLSGPIVIDKTNAKATENFAKAGFR